MDKQQESHKRNLQTGVLAVLQMIVLCWQSHQNRARLPWGALFGIWSIALVVFVVFFLSAYYYWKEYIRGKQA